ncbi:MAG: ABC transporter substrate-binding protein, partial [Alphaproteobacteria bacterium]
MRRRLLLALAIAFVATAIFPMPRTGQAAESIADAEAFIDRLAEQAIAALQDESLDAEMRQDVLTRLLDDSFALDSIGRWVLGRFRNGATAEQEAEYLRLFRLSVIEFMTATLNRYSGEQLVITGALEDGPEGAMVVSRIDQSGGRPFEIIWRIRQTNNGLRIVDVLAGGLSLAKTRRDDYAS